MTLDGGKQYLILTGGDISKNQLMDYLGYQNSLPIICVDGALVLADELGLVPDYIVGDFDTVPTCILQKYKRLSECGEIPTHILTLHPEKDETDTEVALLLAIENKAVSICIFGALGTRMDHSIANIQLLKLALSHHVDAFILDEYNRLYVKDRSFVVEKEKLFGTFLSFLPFEGDVKEVTLNGFKYPVCSRDFRFGKSLGISNELVGDRGSVDFVSGTLLVVEARDERSVYYLGNRR